MKNKYIFAIWMILSTVIFTISLHAQTPTYVNFPITATITTGNSVPLSYQQPSMRAQCLYPAGFISGVPAGMNISTIYHVASNQTPTITSITYTNLSS